MGFVVRKLPSYVSLIMFVAGLLARILILRFLKADGWEALSSFFWAMLCATCGMIAGLVQFWFDEGWFVAGMGVVLNILLGVGLLTGVV
jgi:hypothetical protein